MRTTGPSCTKCSTYLLGLAIGLTSIAATVGITGCHRSADATVAAGQSGPDPADANLAPVANQPQQPVPAPIQRQPARARVLDQHLQNESQQRAEEYAQPGAQTGAPEQPQTNQYPPDQSYPPDQTAQPQYPPSDNNDQAYDDQVDAGQAALEADQPPPQLPVYDQPAAPAPNYIWTPGYWGYAPAGYYWVPGAWVAAPYYGALWTPGYWFFSGDRYRFHHGFWGPHIGYYGGINYGFGYTGYGYHGGYWNGNRFYYNQAVNRVNVTNITNVYNRTVEVNNNTRVSYNGGRGGIQARPQPSELAAMRGPRTPPMTAQIQNQREAAQNHAQFYTQNKGRPAIVSSPRPFVADRNVHPVPVNQSLQRPGQPNNYPQVQPVRPNQAQIQASHPQPAPQPHSEMRPYQPQTQPTPANSQLREQTLRPAPSQPNYHAEPAPQQPHNELRGPNQTVRPTFNNGITEPSQPRPQYEPRPAAQPRPTPEIHPAPQPTPRPAPYVSQPRPTPQPQYHPAPQPQYHPAPQPQYHPAPQPQSHPAPQPHQEQPHGDGHHPR